MASQLDEFSHERHYRKSLHSKRNEYSGATGVQEGQQGTVKPLEGW
jgi:hypothetical protein